MMGIMNKQEFIYQLENLLQNIPEQERIEAIQYYNDYFEDAGEENEQEVLEALGTPFKVAENIKHDLYQNRFVEGMETEKVASGKELVQYQTPNQNTEYSQTATKSTGLSAGIIVLIIVLCILASPLLLVLLCVAATILIAVFSVWLVLVASFSVVSVVLLAVGLVVAIVGIMGIVTNPLAGIGILGGGFLVMAVGLCFLMLVVLIVGKLTPGIFKGIGWIIRKLTGKRKAV